MRIPLKLIVPLLVLAIGAAATLALVREPAAPEVRFATLAGESFTTSELRGKVVLVNFWSTTCASCIAEMPRLTEVYRRHAPRGYEMVAVAMRHDSRGEVAQFVQRHDMPFRVALDASGEIGRQFGNIRVTPTSFLLDKQGRVLRHYVGQPNWVEFEQLVGKALSQTF